MKSLSELNPHDYKGKIFDWDGTLADTLGVWNSVDQKVIRDCSGEIIDLDTIYRERTEFLGRTTDRDVYQAWYRFIKDKYGISTKIEDMLESRRGLSQLEFATLDYKPGAAIFYRQTRLEMLERWRLLRCRQPSI